MHTTQLTYYHNAVKYNITIVDLKTTSVHNAVSPSVMQQLRGRP